jgi:hypothetical protein
MPKESGHMPNEQIGGLPGLIAGMVGNVFIRIMADLEAGFW